MKPYKTWTLLISFGTRRVKCIDTVLKGEAIPLLEENRHRQFSRHSSRVCIGLVYLFPLITLLRLNGAI